MPPSTRVEDDLPTKFNEGSTFVARDSSGLRLKQAEYLVVRGHFLSLQHAPARLSNHSLHQGQNCRGLRKQALGVRLCLFTQGHDDLLALLHHLFRSFDELLIQVLLLDFFVFPFAPQLSMQGLGCLPS
jgi:hypothetical protein